MSIEGLANVRKLVYWNVLDFFELLDKLLADRQLQKNVFAQRVGTSPSVVTDTCKRRRLPPLDRIDIWADALDLADSARADFIHAAYLAHSPPAVVALVTELRAAIHAQSAEIAALKAKLPLAPRRPHRVGAIASQFDDEHAALDRLAEPTQVTQS